MLDRMPSRAELVRSRCSCTIERCVHAQARADVTTSDVAAAYLLLELAGARIWLAPMTEAAPFFRGAASGRFRTIVADPPWPERGGGKTVRGCQRHYPTMTVREIAALPVPTLYGSDGAHLWLWATNSYLEDALLVMRAWGFRYINLRSWFKGEADPEDTEEPIELQNAGIGQYLRGETEQLLFGVRGALPYRYLPDGKRAQLGTALIAPKTTRHSEKPPVHEGIERVSHGPFVELFARRVVPGWSCFGNEQITNDVELVVPPRPEPVVRQLLLGGVL